MDRKQVGFDSKLELGELNSEVRVSIDNESRASFSVQWLERSQLPAVVKPMAREITAHWLMSVCWFGCCQAVSAVSGHPALTSKMSQY